jgi:hypothetical protein
MSITSFNPMATSNWNLDLPVGGAAPAAPVAPVAPVQATAPTPTATPVANPWGNWNGKGSTFDYAYDAYMFTKFPLNIGGPSFWGGGPIRRTIASAFSKIGQDRLAAYAIRAEFLKVPGMTPDSARLLEMAYVQQTNGQAPLSNKAPIRWLSQFGGGGGVNDFLVRGPLMILLGTCAAQCAMQFGFLPDVPGVGTIKDLGDAAMRIAPQVPSNMPYQQ